MSLNLKMSCHVGLVGTELNLYLYLGMLVNVWLDQSFSKCSVREDCLKSLTHHWTAGPPVSV